MLLELLERLERAEPGVLVIEPGLYRRRRDSDRGDREAAGVGALIRRPANGVLDQSGLDAAFGQLPNSLIPSP